MAKVLLRWLLRLALPLILLGLLLAGVVWRGLEQWADTPLLLPEAGVTYDVPAGASLRTVFADFSRRGYLPSAEPLRWYLRLRPGEHRLQAGEYRLTAGLTPRTLLALFAAGAVVQHAVTFPEGWTLAQVLALLQQQPGLQQTVAGTGAVAAVLGLPADMSAEGWVFPDTYYYRKGMTDADILRTAHRAMQATLDHLWAGRAAGLPYATPYEALVMASLVERETGQPAERGAIAGVFVRRLQQGMRLQTDPTVIYGLGERYDGNLTRAHLREPGPYNTYLNAGLPPTPIAMPGAEALYAALHPEPGTALYFVARGDGSHVFSATLEEHTAAVQRYQVRERPAQYRSRPAGP